MPWKPPAHLRVEGRRELAPSPEERSSSARVVMAGVLARVSPRRLLSTDFTKHRTYCATFGLASAHHGSGVTPEVAHRCWPCPRRTQARRGSFPASTSLGLGALRYRPSAFCARVFSQSSGWTLRLFSHCRVVVQTFTRFGFPVRSASAVGMLVGADGFEPPPPCMTRAEARRSGSPAETTHPQIMAPGSTPGQQHTASCLRWVARPRCPLHFLSAPSQPLFAVSKCGPPLSGTSREHRHASGCSALGFHVSAPRLACPSTPAMI